MATETGSAPLFWSALERSDLTPARFCLPKLRDGRYTLGVGVVLRRGGRPGHRHGLLETELIGLLGLALIGLTLYVSTLTFSLRAHSRSRLSSHLSGNSQREWLDWLDRHETDLLVVTAFTRVGLSLGLLTCVAIWLADSDAHQFKSAYVAEAILTTLGLLLVFAIAIPNALSRYVGELILAYNLRVLQGLRLILRPIAYVAQAVDFVVMRLLGKSRETEDEESQRLEQEILNAVSEGEAHGAVDEEQADMIESVVEMPDTDVEAIMTPRTEIVAVPADASYADVRKILLQEGHSRLPVIEASLDHIIGVLYIKDLLRIESPESFDARKLMRSVPYIPVTKKIRDLLNELRHVKVHIAIVLDEYGGTAGLVTFEDIIEQVIGEIADEYEAPEEPPIKRIDEDTIDVDARVHISEISEELDIELPDNGDYETVGGFVFSTLGRIPKSGEQFTHENIEIRILDAEPRKINRLIIKAVREPRAA